MKRKLILLKAALALAAVFIFLPVIPSAAADSGEIPYQSYTYWENYSGETKREVYSRPMYQAHTTLNAEALGIKAFSGLTDICVDSERNVYVLDGAGSAIYVLDSEYRLKYSLKEVQNGAETLSFVGAKGIFVSGNGELYISDTDNGRVLKTDLSGILLKEFTVPDSGLIPDGFEFRPMKTAVDKRGYVYILCDGSYYGAILYSPENEFLGFYGSNTTSGGILQAFEIIFNKLFMTNSKLSKSESKLPFQITDLYMDSRNFVYTCTGRTETDTVQTGQIRRFSPGGIMTEDTSSINFADADIGTVKGEKLGQDLLGIALDDNDFIYALDSTYGRVFLYDKEYKLLSAFGSGMGRGEQVGSFVLPCAIDINGDDVLVCDSSANTVTVFKITDYGRLVKQARKMTLDGNYEESKELWQNVLSLDKNSQLAYNGLAKAYYVEENYEKAMEYAKLGIDKETYAQSFKWVRRDYVKKNFVWIFIPAVAAVGGICAAVVYVTGKKRVLIKNEKIRTALSSLAHPFDSFSKFKYGNQGSVLLAFVLLALFYITSVMKSTVSGYLYVDYPALNFNSLYVIVRTFGLVILWSAVNWAVCALMGGIGKLREIFTVTCYSLIPLILGNLLYVALTNVMLPAEAGFLSVLMNVAVIYAGFMLIVGIMKVQDYEFGKFVGTSVITVVGMAIALCLIAIIIILVQQLGAFLLTVIMEIAYR